MQGDNHFELAHYALGTLYQKMGKDRELKRIRAVAYRQKKKQQEKERATSLQMLTNRNMTLWNEIKRLKREKEQRSADLAKYITLCQQLSAKLYQTHCRMGRSEYHEYTGSNELWNTSGWEIDENQLVIEGDPNNGAPPMIQGDNQTASDGDLTNNQGMNSDEASIHNDEWTCYMGDML